MVIWRADCEDLTTSDATLEDGHTCKLPVLIFPGEGVCTNCLDLHRVALPRQFRSWTRRQCPTPCNYSRQSVCEPLEGIRGAHHSTSCASPSCKRPGDVGSEVGCLHVRACRHCADAGVHATAGGQQQPSALGDRAGTCSPCTIRRPHCCGQPFAHSHCTCSTFFSFYLWHVAGVTTSHFL